MSEITINVTAERFQQMESSAPESVHAVKLGRELPTGAEVKLICGANEARARVRTVEYSSYRPRLAPRSYRNTHYMTYLTDFRRSTEAETPEKVKPVFNAGLYHLLYQDAMRRKLSGAWTEDKFNAWVVMYCKKQGVRPPAGIYDKARVLPDSLKIKIARELFVELGEELDKFEE